MRPFLQALAVFALAAVAGFFVVVWQLPDFIMGRLMSRVQATASDGRTTPPLPDDKSRSIVLPSPDLAYVLCVFDLSKGAMAVEFNPPPLPYWSVAAYAANTDNFAVLNDRTSGGVHRLVLLPPGATPSAPSTAGVVAPTTRGIVLFRGLMPNRDAELLKQVQASVSCRPAR